MRVKIDKLFLVEKSMGLIKSIKELRERKIDVNAIFEAKREIDSGRLEEHEKNAFKLGFRKAHPQKPLLTYSILITSAYLFMGVFSVYNKSALRRELRESNLEQKRIIEFYQENESCSRDTIPEYLDARMRIGQDENRLRLLEETERDSLYNSN